MRVRGVGPTLIFLAGPQVLLAAGLPRVLRERLLAPLLASRALRAVLMLFAHPFAATFWLVAVPVFWHLPAYHDRSVLDDSVHYVMHITMLVSALFFFWCVLDPRPAPLGASYATRIVMCWAAIAGTIPLGAYLSLKSTALYASYDEKGRLWGLPALQDEQLGGIVIWIPGSMMFVVLLLVVIRLWASARGPGGSAAAARPGTCGAGAGAARRQSRVGAAARGDRVPGRRGRGRVGLALPVYALGSSGVAVAASSMEPPLMSSRVSASARKYRNPAAIALKG